MPPEPNFDFPFLEDAAKLANEIMRRDNGDALDTALALIVFATVLVGDDDAGARRRLGLEMLKRAHELLPDFHHELGQA